MANTCEQCGKDMDLVGRVHNCVPKERAVSPTYQYRDPEKRRAYMKEYMRKKRADTG